jgi:hypothetical protein
MPGSRESPAELLARAAPLGGTAGAAYVERRGVAVAVAVAAGVRYDPDFGGRPAVVVGLRDDADVLTSVHGRYLHHARGQDKMLTIGPGGGAIDVLGGWRSEPVLLVEGLFDALSLAACGRAAVATIGRRAPWLAGAIAGKTVGLAFDGNRPGDEEAARYAEWLRASHVFRLRPPARCKDWNTALLKLGCGAITRWVRERSPAPRSSRP